MNRSVLLTRATCSALLVVAMACAVSPATAATADERHDRLVSSVPVGIDVASHQHIAHAPRWSQIADADDTVVNKGQTVDETTPTRVGDPVSEPSFTIVKATEGLGYDNPAWSSDISQARENGISVGGYHYARPSRGKDNARKQAEKFAKAIRDAGGQQLPPALDIEESGGLSPRELRTWIDEFVSTSDRLTGQTTMIYTYPYFWASALADTEDFSDRPLWIADYDSAGTPRVPGGWNTWTFWQDSSTSTVQGITGAVDRNLFNGTSSSLGRMLSGVRS